ncbi:MAG: corrinoid protein, partial [Burkholderiaceae bacterium]|nr:corrinoid protein [Burkholderiaceae bacterium]
WGANFDDMITYPPYFEREIQPWIRKVSAAVEARGKLLMCHTDGENEGLMDLIRDSGMHIAESICPAPMTKLSLAEYYQRWGSKLTLFGGVPSTVVLPETSEEDFEAYLDELFRAVAPGTRYLVGVADQVPPGAIFSRLQRIGERVEREGSLPLKAGAFRPLPTAGAGGAVAASAAAEAGEAAGEEIYAQVRQDVSKGKHLAIREHVAELLAQGVAARDILDKGLIAAIDVVGKRMASGEAFIPEVLLAARAMSSAVSVLEPHLAAGGSNEKRGRVLIGTVKGDMHDIGKNLVVTMLRGVGFDVIDLGVNVARETFCDAVAEHRPDVIGLSALLTTTMMEMREIIRELDARGLRGKCKVFVGGAPVSDKFARQIGADGFAVDAVQAVNEAKRLLAA